MIGLFIATHGQMAEGMSQSIEMLVGGESIPFCGLDARGIEDFEERLFEMLDDELTRHERLIVFCDIQGGSPANTALKYKYTVNDKIQIIAGANLPLIAEVVSDIENYNDSAESIATMIKLGQEAIQKLEL